MNSCDVVNCQNGFNTKLKGKKCLLLDIDIFFWNFPTGMILFVMSVKCQKRFQPRKVTKCCMIALFCNIQFQDSSTTLSSN